MKYQLLILVALLFFIGCRFIYDDKSDATTISVIPVSDTDIIRNVNVSDVIELDSFVVLETKNESLFGRVGKVVVTDDRIYVMDDWDIDVVLCFNRKGRFINIFNKTGKGPDEYDNLDDFDANDGLVAVKAGNRFFKLDKDLNLIESIAIPWETSTPTGGKVLLLDNNNVLFQMQYLKYRYYYFDMKANKMIGQISLNQGVGDCHINLALSLTSDGKILSTLMRSDTIYQLTEDTLLPYKVVDFEFALSVDQQKQLVEIGFMEKKPFSTIKYMKEVSSYCELETFITFEYIYNQRNHHYMFNKATGRYFSFNNDLPNDVFGQQWFTSTVGFYKNSSIASVDAIDLISNKNNLIVEIPEGLSENSNPVLVFYHPRFN